MSLSISARQFNGYYANMDGAMNKHLISQGYALSAFSTINLKSICLILFTCQ